MKHKNQVYTNALFRKITYIYSMILLLIGILASYMAYSKEHITLISQMEQTMDELKHDYERYTEDFWRLYMPIVQDRGGTYTILKKYFAAEGKAAMSPIDKSNLVDALQTIIAYNHGISWIGVYVGGEAENYLLFEGDSALTEMHDDFPFIEDMENKGPAKEIYGSKLVNKAGKLIRSFAICGNLEESTKSGKLIFGYATDKIGSAYMQDEKLENARFIITNEHGVVYDSFGEYDEKCMSIAESVGSIYHNDGEMLYVYRLQGTGKEYSVFCTIPWLDKFFVSHSFTPYIVVMVLLFCICSLVIYRMTGKGIIRKINVIQQGLHKIGENELDYRIEVPDTPTDEFENISQSINKMTERLQENIDKTYELRLKQKEAVLAELQAKFDPHFLYNTLEVIRGRVYENGDIETSDIIIKLAQIFRSFIGSERFVSIRDEMDFCNMYLSLLKYRYEDRITIIYDIESEILEYGIIRNLLQPILENFFVHGFKPESQHNMLQIRGKICDEKYIWFYIWDNGLGIPEERLIELKESFKQSESSAGSSYGLKNVHRRIKLFYGRDCGLEIKSNEAGGTTVEVKIRRLTCIGHEMRMYDIEDFDE